MSRAPCVYILANRRQGDESRYACNRLVFYESDQRMDEAIAREKQIKGGSLAKKIALIETMNPDWKDLYDSFA